MRVVDSRLYCLGAEEREFSSTEVSSTRHCRTSPSPRLKSQLLMTKSCKAAIPKVCSSATFAAYDCALQVGGIPQHEALFPSMSMPPTWVR